MTEFNKCQDCKYWNENDLRLNDRFGECTNGILLERLPKWRPEAKSQILDNKKMYYSIDSTYFDGEDKVSCFSTMIYLTGKNFGC
ncbi:MAG: hypothetical protein ACW99A_22865, partial [Candidatus Kariarchaeaceae archaeon]